MQAPSTKRKNLWILTFTLFVVMLGFGMIIPIMPFYIEHLGAGGSELGIMMASYAVMRLIFGPIWGSASDRLGRKPVLMVGILGYGITMVLFGLATKMWMLIVIRSLSGILSSATAPTTMAYISDSTGEKERGSGMGMLGAAMGLGTIAGPGLGGLLGTQSLALPFFIAGGMSFLALLFTALFLPESLPVENRRPRMEKAQVSRARQLWQALFSPIGVLLAITFLNSYALTGFSGIFGLYASARYQYGTQQVGVLFMVVGLVAALTQGVLTGPLIRRMGEAALIKASLLVAAVGFVCMAAARIEVTILLSIGLFTLAIALLTPSVTALISQRTRLEQGFTMGLNNSFESLGRILGPLVGGVLFDWNINFPYWSGGLVMLGGFILALSRISKPGQTSTPRPGESPSRV